MANQILKPALTYEAQREIIDLVLEAGQLLLQHGAETQRIEETVHRMGTGLGCDWLDVLVSPDGILVTTTSGQDFRTKFRRVVRISVNLALVAEINTLSRQVEAGALTLVEAQAEIQRIRHQPLHYSRRVIIVAVGMGCAAFCRLFGGDVTAVVTTLIAASIAMFTRQELHKHHLNPLLIVMLTAFTAGVIAGIGATWRVSERPQAALAASVLLLVPGVPLVNAAGDLLKGYIVTGTMRGVYGALISFCIALGLLLAMALTGVTDV